MFDLCYCMAIFSCFSPPHSKERVFVVLLAMHVSPVTPIFWPNGYLLKFYEANNDIPGPTYLLYIAVDTELWRHKI